MTVPLLAARGLSVTLATPARGTPQRVLEDVEFRLEAGECLAVVGESGAGKSQLVRVLLGLSPAGARIDGELRLRGELLAPADRAAWARVRGAGIGIVHQDSLGALAPHRRVGQQLIDVLLAHGASTRSAARADACRWLERVSIPDAPRRFGQYPFELSGGLRQRVAIALALAAGPAVLVADEPTSALDPPLAVELMRLLADLKRDPGLALLLVSHDLSVVAGVADRVLVLYRGVALEAGAVDALYARPRHPYTRRLLAAAAGRDEDRGASDRPPVDRAACVYVASCALATAACEQAPDARRRGDALLRCHHPLGGAL